MKGAYVTMWYFSVACLSVALCFFALCFVDYWYPKYYVPFVSLLSISVILFAISYKPLRCENGHTLIQAINYYRTCKRNGYKSHKDRDVLIAVADDMDILSNCELEDKMKFYNEGKKITESINNPLIIFIWKIQERFISSKK